MISAANTATLLSSSIGPSINSGIYGSVADIGVPATKGNMSAAQIDKTSNDFESMFVSQMLGQMFGDSIGDEAFGDKDTSDIYKGMMMDAYGKEIAKAGGIGIADYVKKELLKLQEAK